MLLLFLNQHTMAAKMASLIYRNETPILMSVVAVVAAVVAVVEVVAAIVLTSSAPAGNVIWCSSSAFPGTLLCML